MNRFRTKIAPMKKFDQSFVSFRHFGIFILLLSVLFLFGGWKKGQKKQTKQTATSSKPKKRKILLKEIKEGETDRYGRTLLLSFKKYQSVKAVQGIGQDRPRIIVLKFNNISRTLLFLDANLKVKKTLDTGEEVTPSQDGKAIALYFHCSNCLPFGLSLRLIDDSGKIILKNSLIPASSIEQVVRFDNYRKTFLLTRSYSNFAYDVSCNANIFILNKKGKILPKKFPDVWDAQLSPNGKEITYVVQHRGGFYYGPFKGSTIVRVRINDMKILWKQKFERAITSLAASDKHVAITTLPCIKADCNIDHPKTDATLYLLDQEGKIEWKTTLSPRLHVAFWPNQQFLACYNQGIDTEEKKHRSFLVDIGKKQKILLDIFENGKQVDFLGMLRPQKILYKNVLGLSYGIYHAALINTLDNQVIIENTYQPFPPNNQYLRSMSFWYYQNKLMFANIKGIYSIRSKKFEAKIRETLRKARMR